MQAGHTVSSHGIICANLKHISPQLEDNLLVTVTNTHKINILPDFHLQTTLLNTFIVYNCLLLFICVFIFFQFESFVSIVYSTH